MTTSTSAAGTQQAGVPGQTTATQLSDHGIFSMLRAGLDTPAERGARSM